MMDEGEVFHFNVLFVDKVSNVCYFFGTMRGILLYLLVFNYREELLTCYMSNRCFKAISAVGCMG